MKFKIGESVVCINDDFSWARKKFAAAGMTFPVRGKCYVVRGYVIKGSHPGIVLQGIKNPKVVYNDGRLREGSFWEERFEKAPSIDRLKEIAKGAPRWVPEKEDA